MNFSSSRNGDEADADGEETLELRCLSAKNAEEAAEIVQKMPHPTALRGGQPVAETGLTVEGTNVMAGPAGEAASGLTVGERQLWQGGQGASDLSSTPNSRDVLSSLGDEGLTTPGATAQLSAEVRPASATTSRPTMQVPGLPLQSHTSAQS